MARTVKIGAKFGKLKVLKELDRRETSYHRIFLCQCSCGADHIVRGTELVQGRTWRCTWCNKKAGVKTRQKRAARKK